LESLGEGAAGKVFLAVLTVDKTFGGKTGDLFAVKQYKKEFLKEKRQIERIEIERKIGFEISNPNIVRIFESSSEHVDTPYLVMEYIDGITLKDWIKMFAPIPEDWICLVLDQIIDGITELHSMNIEHRDIKPENIMLTADFTAKIMDLGVIQVPDKPGISEPGRLLGTIRNSSPDVLKGSSYTQLDDIYSLGTVAYALLHGYQIFPEENTGQGLKDKVLKEKICFEDKTIKSRGKLCSELLSLTKRIMNKERKAASGNSRRKGILRGTPGEICDHGFKANAWLYSNCTHWFGRKCS
jgi:serine/threonine protein kinase